MVAGWTLVSRATGLVRIVVIGAVLGPTYLANTFITTNMVPNLTYSVIAGQALASVVVPAVIRARERGGDVGASKLLGRVGGFLLIASAAMAAIVAIASPAVAWLMTFGIPDPELRAAAHYRTVVLILLVAPQIVFYTVAALGAAAQQSRQRFALAAAAPAAENLLLSGTVLVVGGMWGTGLEVDEVSGGLLMTLGAGSTLAVGAHAGLQLFGAWRAGMPVRPRLRWMSDPEAVEIARRLRGSISVPAAPTVGMFALLVVAATVPGGVVVVQAAYTVFVLPTALGARAVAIAVLPGMSAASERRDRVGFAVAWRQALTYSAITSLPLLVLLGTLAHPVAEALANGELSSPVLIDQLAACLMVVAVAQVAAGIHEIGRQALFARIDIRGPRQASLTALTVTLAVAATALLASGGTARLIMLCTALLAGELAGAITVIAKLRAAIRPEQVADGVRLIAALAATSAMVPAVAAGWWLLEANEFGRITDQVFLAACGLLALASYALALRADVWTMIGRRP